MSSTDYVNAFNKMFQSRDHMGSYSASENAKYWGKMNNLLEGVRSDPDAYKALSGQMNQYKTQSEQLQSSADAMNRAAAGMDANTWANMSSGDQQKYAQGKNTSTSNIIQGLAQKGDVNEGVFTQMTPQQQQSLLQKFYQQQAMGQGGAGLGMWGEGGNNPISQTYDSVSGTAGDIRDNVSGANWGPSGDTSTPSEVWGGISNDPWGSVRSSTGTFAGGMAGAAIPSMAIPGMIGGAYGGGQLGSGNMAMPWDKIREALGTAGGATIGSVLGVPGMIAGGVTGNKIGGGSIGGGGGGGSNVGDNIPMPDMSPFESLNTQGIGGYLPTSGLDAYQKRATDVGPSPWAQMMTQRQGLEQTDLLNQASQNSATQAATARSNLAMHGGLRGGAMERLSGQAGNDLALSKQNVLNQGNLARANIGVQDEGIKNQFLQGLPGQQIASAQYRTGVDTANAGNAAANAQAQNQYNLTKYGEQMKLKGAGMTSQAIANAGKK